MPLWVKWLLLSVGASFLVVGITVGVFGAQQARDHLALLQRLHPLSAVAFGDQRVGDAVLVEGVISPHNLVVLPNVVAYVREELDVRVESDGDRSETWHSDGRETPRLALDADGVVRVGNETYAIEQPHNIWYDEGTLDVHGRPRDGSKRYYGLVANRTVTVFGTVVRGPQGNELHAQTVFGSTYEAYLAWERQATAFLPIFGGIFGAVGFLLCALAIVFLRRPHASLR